MIHDFSHIIVVVYGGKKHGQSQLNYQSINQSFGQTIVAHRYTFKLQQQKYVEMKKKKRRNRFKNMKTTLDQLAARTRQTNV